MSRQTLATRQVIIAILCLQFIPLILFPPASFQLTSQEWWLPVLLAVIAMIGVFQLVFRHSVESWPWYLISFCHGFNIIIRLMMLLPHITRNDNGAQVFNAPYFFLTVASILLSTLVLLYTELPDVRQGLLKE
jgi:hypothetical protein